MSTRSREGSFIIRSSLDIQPGLCLRLPDRRTSFSSLESPRKPFYEHRLENADPPRLRTRCAGKRGACQRHTGRAGHVRTAARSARRTASCRQQNTARTVVGEEGYVHWAPAEPHPGPQGAAVQKGQPCRRRPGPARRTGTSAQTPELPDGVWVPRLWGHGTRPRGLAGCRLEPGADWREVRSGEWTISSGLEDSSEVSSSVPLSGVTGEQPGGHSTSGLETQPGQGVISSLPGVQTL